MEPDNCRRCGKAILRGTVDIYQMMLDPSPVPEEDARVLERYKIPVVEILIRQVGDKVLVTDSRMYWPGENKKDWHILLAHGCSREREDWGK